METQTPETDALTRVVFEQEGGASDDYSAYAKMLEHARELEQQRNQLIKALDEALDLAVQDDDDFYRANRGPEDVRRLSGVLNSFK